MNPAGDVELVFDPLAVPCDPTTVQLLRSDLLEYLARCHEPFEDELLATLTPVTDMTEFHKLLLAARRGRRHTYTTYRIDRCLKGVRSHSRYRSVRSCYCLAKAWNQFRADLRTTLDDSRLSDARTVWACGKQEGAHEQDLRGALTDAHICSVVYGGHYLSDVPPSAYGRGPLRVRITQGPDDLVRVLIRARPRGMSRMVTITVQQLDDKRAAIARACAYRRAWPEPLGSRLLLMPDAAIDLALAWPAAGADRFEVARELTDAGAAELTPAACDVAQALAGGWTLSPTELVTAVDAAADAR